MVYESGVVSRDGELVEFGHGTTQMDSAVKFLESKGMTFGGEYGYDNAIKKATELGWIPPTTKSQDVDKQLWYSGFLWIAQERGHSEGWAAYRMKSRFGTWPNGLKREPCMPTSAVRSWDTHERIKYSKSKQKASTPQVSA